MKNNRKERNASEIQVCVTYFVDSEIYLNVEQEHIIVVVVIS